MNNCDLCGKETFTEFTVKSKHLRWVLSEDLQKLDTHKNNWLTKNICEDCFKKIFGKQEENYIIEQNAGENRIEGGVVGISGSVSEKHYRPFKDCNELKVWFYINKTGISKSVAEEFSKITPPSIWVRHKFNKDDQCIITRFGKIEANTIPVVEIRGMDLTMKELFENWEFLDGSLCGCLEE